jgi:hypothetical protein
MSIGYRARKNLTTDSCLADHGLDERRRWLAEQQKRDKANPPTLQEMFDLEAQDEARRADLFVICACALLASCFFLAWWIA